MITRVLSLLIHFSVTLVFLSNAVADDKPANAQWTLIWSDNISAHASTFQSHVKKMVRYDGKTHIAYTYKKPDGNTSNILVSIDDERVPGLIAKNTSSSNSGCLAVVNGRLFHVYEDFIAKVLIVAPEGNGTRQIIPDFVTAGKITCLEFNGDLMVASSYGEVLRLRFDAGGRAEWTRIRDRLILTKPESLQYPYLAKIQDRLLVANVSASGGWYYKNLYVSSCLLDNCTRFKGIFPGQTVLANSWVGDIHADDEGAIYVYFSENELHYKPKEYFEHASLNEGKIGIYNNGRWKIQSLGSRILSGRFLKHGPDLLLVTMSLSGVVSVYNIKDGEAFLIHEKPLALSCYYALDSTIDGSDLYLLVTDIGKDCKSDRRTAQLWQVNILANGDDYQTE